MSDDTEVDACEKQVAKINANYEITPIRRQINDVQRAENFQGRDIELKA